MVNTDCPTRRHMPHVLEAKTDPGLQIQTFIGAETHAVPADWGLLPDCFVTAGTMYR